MKLLSTLIICAFTGFIGHAQFDFQSAYNSNPLLPSGLLESVAWNNTRVTHLSNQAESCSGLPQAYGVMGLHDDGHDYFVENGREIARLSGISVANQKADANQQILAFARAYTVLMNNEILNGLNQTDVNSIYHVLKQMSEIPSKGIVNHLAQDMQVYSVFSFMNDIEKAQEFNFSVHTIEMEKVFGLENFSVLSSAKINFTETEILSENNIKYLPIIDESTRSLEFGPAIWNPSPSCNYSSRSGTAISAITIHTVQGSYAGAISWAQNCSSNVSYHYVIRSSDGQVTQMVLEADKAWHVGTENPYAIGYEHEGYVDNPAWYTDEMYNSSSELSRDVVNSGYGIPPLRTYYGVSSLGQNTLGACTRIKGHQHFPNQTHTDPGINWDWERYYRLVNNNTPITTISDVSGTFFDTGGPTGDYQDDERQMWLFQPPGALTVTIDFSLFNIEQDWDYLFIYDGDTIGAPLIGVYTGTNSPGSVTSSGGSLFVEFRSDCATMASGWNAAFTSVISTGLDETAPTTAILNGVLWQTDDFTVDFSDNDTESGVATKFYLAAEKNLVENEFHANGNASFARETFADNDDSWFAVTGAYSIIGGKYVFSDISEQNSNTYLEVQQNNSEVYLYEWDQTITSNDVSQRAGMHFFCDDPNQSNRGNSYFVYLRDNDNAVEIYSVNNNVFSSESFVTYPVNNGQTYNCKTTFDPSNGWIKVYVNDSLISQWQDLTPLSSGGFISLRSGGCSVEFDNVRVYHSRGSQTTISTSGTTGEMTIESESAVPSGAIYSMIIDSAENWSNIDIETYRIDFSPPTLTELNDGTGNDIDTFSTPNIAGNWIVNDIHSMVADYEVAVGTSPSSDDIVAWTSNSISSLYSTVLVSPIYGQVYYLSISATNNAGLMSEFTSDGQVYLDDVGISELSALLEITMYPNPSTEFVYFKNAPDNFKVLIYDASGRVVVEKTLTTNHSIDVSHLSKAQYSVILEIGGEFVVRKLMID